MTLQLKKPPYPQELKEDDKLPFDAPREKDCPFLSFSEKKNFNTHLISVTHDGTTHDGTARDLIHSDVLKYVDVYQIMSSKIFGAHSETRTRDLLLTRQTLFH